MVTFCGVSNNIGMICMSKCQNGRKVIFWRFWVSFVISIFFHGYDTNSHTCDGSYSEVGRNEPTGQGNCQKGEIITFLDPNVQKNGRNWQNPYDYLSGSSGQPTPSYGDMLVLIRIWGSTSMYDTNWLTKILSARFLPTPELELGPSGSESRSRRSLLLERSCG